MERGMYYMDMAEVEQEGEEMVRLVVTLAEVVLAEYLNLMKKVDKFMAEAEAEAVDNQVIHGLLEEAEVPEAEVKVVDHNHLVQMEVKIQAAEEEAEEHNMLEEKEGPA